jgi:3-hydroxyisobutyrate dehydrogenase-like beta-hydroxyacid dehydrogenase
MPMRTTRPKGTVGVIGLGIMGGAFARNLLADGWRVVGHDVDPGQRRALARAGVEIAADAKHLAGEVRTIITSLPSTVALAQTVEAVVDAAARPLVIVEAGTFALADKLEAARALAAAGHVMLDCPISGTGAQAKSKDIVVYASGDRKAIKRLRPLFAGFARATHDLGALGNGSRMKYVANLLVAINNVAAAEAMVLGMKAGLKPQMIYDMVTSGVGNSRIFELRGPMMVRNRYDDATMKVSIWQKDMQVIGEFADALACPTPLFSATRPIYAAALASGHAADDTAAVCAVLEAKAGVKRGKRAKKAGTPRLRRKVG